MSKLMTTTFIATENYGNGDIRHSRQTVISSIGEKALGDITPATALDIAAEVKDAATAIASRTDRLLELYKAGLLLSGVANMNSLEGISQEISRLIYSYARLEALARAAQK